MRGYQGRRPGWRPGAGTLAFLSALWLVGPVAAQKPPEGGHANPLVLLVMPPGGQAGSTVEVTVSGQELEDPQDLFFSLNGIKAERLAAPAPPPPDAKRPNNRRPNQNRGALTSHKFKVTIPAGAAPGIHDLRLVTRWGVSNPRAFVVGDLPEVLEKEPNDDVGQAQRVPLNTTVSGVITSPTDVDYFIFSGKKGQRVVVSCLASSIDSRLQPGLELYDHAGRQLAFNKNYHDTDALLDCTLPADGDYYVRLYEFTYTLGGPEYFYRLSISTAPWIDAVFPPVVEPGKPAKLTVYGRNLPGGQPDPSAVVDGRALEKLEVAVDVPGGPVAGQRLVYSGRVPPHASGVDGFEYRLRNAVGASNPFLLTYAQAPLVRDNGQHETPETAQPVSPPCEIAGRIERKGGHGCYAFPAKKGEVYSIEAYGDRLGAPLDLYFQLRDARGKTMTEMDDNPELLHPIQFYTRTDDPPRYRFVVPADGTYQLLVGSREASVQAGPRDFYRVRITPEAPDFRLVVMPQSITSPDATVIRAGGRQYYTVFVWRQDGWDQPITLTAEGLPEGVTCPPQSVGPGAAEATLVVSAAPDARAWVGAIRVKGTATVNGQTLVREARAATITWPTPPQQNVPTISRLDRQVVLAVRPDKTPYTLDAGVVNVSAAPGEKITIPVKVARQGDFKTPIQVSVLNLPDGQRGRNRRNNPANTVQVSKDSGSVVVDLRGNVPPGTYTLVLRGDTQPPGRGGQARQQGSANLVQVSAPITLTVTARRVVR